MRELLAEDKLGGVPLLVFANKQDLLQARSVSSPLPACLLAAFPGTLSLLSDLSSLYEARCLLLSGVTALAFACQEWLLFILCARCRQSSVEDLVCVCSVYMRHGRASRGLDANVGSRSQFGARRKRVGGKSDLQHPLLMSAYIARCCDLALLILVALPPSIELGRRSLSGALFR